ncbi:RimK family alpha-L-glutamate ligase [Nocardia sp. NPDC127526]|uniref:RimK family alpha-L-glutamate ligase n=1 Tax=Nocardia sp. NPDC127526 TaxID=3345393 RepID=UPI00363EE70F
MISEPEVLLSITMLRPDEAALVQAFRDHDLPVRIARNEDLAEVVSQRTGLPGLAVIRNLSHRDAVSVARRLEILGVRVVNRPSAIEVCNDKGLQALVFDRHGVPHPLSRHAFSYEQVRSAVADTGYRAVVKPISGSWGRGVSRLLDADSLEAWIGGRESADAAGKLFPVLVQEYIDKPGYDLRVIVVGRSPVVAIQRISDHWRTNTHLGAEVKRVDITPEIADLCDRTVAVLGAGFYGVDLLADRTTGHMKVLEVNANPEFTRSALIHGVDVAGQLAAYLAGRVRAESAAIAG